MLTVVFWGRYWGTLIFGKYHIGLRLRDIYGDDGEENGNYYNGYILSLGSKV